MHWLENNNTNVEQVSVDRERERVVGNEKSVGRGEEKKGIENEMQTKKEGHQRYNKCEMKYRRT
jgi:hypothetical protein